MNAVGPLPAAQPDFWIGDIPIHGRLILAPMDGISDPTFRWITRRLGSAYSISEFVNTLDYANQKHYQMERLAFREDERPFTAQLLDNTPERMAECAARIEAELHPDLFDINLGCSVRSVMGRGAGVGMMRNPGLVAEACRQVKAATHVPLTVKMRLGWDDHALNYMEVAEAAVANGAAAVALHARTGKMAYNGKARWAEIRKLKESLPVPVIGNGDVLTVADARRMFAETGCDAVMIGRAAKGNPWIFSWREREVVPLREVRDLAIAQYVEMERTYPHGAVMAFRKYLKAYLEPYALPSGELRALLTVADPGLFLGMLKRTFEELGEVREDIPNPG